MVEECRLWLTLLSAHHFRYLCSLKFGMNLALITEFGGHPGRPGSGPGCPHGEEAYSPKCMASMNLLKNNSIDQEEWYIYAAVLGGLFVVLRVLAATLLAARAT